MLVEVRLILFFAYFLWRTQSAHAALTVSVAMFITYAVKLIGLSCNNVDDHDAWVKDIEALRGPGSAPTFPIIADPKRDVAALLGMVRMMYTLRVVLSPSYVRGNRRLLLDF